MSSVQKFVIVCGVLVVVAVMVCVAVTINQSGRKQPAEIIMMTAVVPGCGNGLIESDEECDGAALSGATCLSKGFTGGVLLCTKSCLYNVTSCTNLASSSDSQALTRDNKSTVSLAAGGETYPPALRTVVHNVRRVTTRMYQLLENIFQ